MTHVHRDALGRQIIDSAIKVHRTLGPGLLESSYEVCLDHELNSRGLRVVRHVPVPVVYEGVRLDCGYRLDLVVNGCIVIEVKSVEKLLPLHTAQVLTYLRLSGARQILLFNFNCVKLMDGLRSFLGDGKQRSQQPCIGRAPGEHPFPRAPGLGGASWPGK
jgi:GxxExxY protein